MNKHNSQQGSAHVVIVVCLVLALLTALGWIFYQNFIHKEPSKTQNSLTESNKEDKTSKTDEALAENTTKPEEDKETATVKPEEEKKPAVTQPYQIYTGSTFTFQYPKDGWKRDDTETGLSGGGSITTSNYTTHPYSGYPQAGARISVSVNKRTETLKKPTTKDAAGISNIQTLQVDGRVAYFYRIDYEGIRYKVQVQSNTQNYMIELMGTGDATRAQKDVFNQVWKTFDIK